MTPKVEAHARARARVGSASGSEPWDSLARAREVVNVTAESDTLHYMGMLHVRMQTCSEVL